MADHDCDCADGKLKDVLVEILSKRHEVAGGKYQSTPRVSMLVRMITNDLQDKSKHATLKRELMDVAAAAIHHLEKTL
jgi:hypothetical protein